MTSIGSEVDKQINFNKYEDNLKNLIRIPNAKGEVIKMGGGGQAIEKHHKRGKLTARKRIAKLIDPKSHFFEMR